MADEITRLRGFSGRLLERELFVCSASELEILQAVGEPSSDSSFTDKPPQLVWDLEWPCGLTASLLFDQLTQRLTGHLDRPEVEHTFRHLEIDPEDPWLLEREYPDRFAAQCEPPDRSFELWRQDDDGTKVRIGAGRTEGDVNCWRDELERRGDKPRYWVQHAGEESSAAGAEAPDPVQQQLIQRLARTKAADAE